MQFESRKNLAGIGALLFFVSFLISSSAPPFGSGFIAIIGLILMLIGVKGLADYYRKAGIFNNILYGTIAGIAGVVIAIAVAIGVLINSLSSFLHKIFPNWNGDWATLSGMTPTTTNLTFSDIAPFFTAAIAILVILFVFTIIAALLYRRSLSSIKNKSGIGLFGTTGTVFLIGAVLTIILIGYVILWIGFLLLAIAFFQLKLPSVQTTLTTQTITPPAGIPSETEKISAISSQIEKKYCTNCRAELTAEAIFCPKCGLKQGQ
ncbi:MAG: hypothetical protein QG670_2553 [Thermoproteota archaeon]|nr:hypothetical protein [Thermoproteota archaeon]